MHHHDAGKDPIFLPPTHPRQNWDNWMPAPCKDHATGGELRAYNCGRGENRNFAVKPMHGEVI